MESKKYCSNCQEEINENDNFCNHCGKKINKDKKEKSSPFIITMIIFIVSVLIPTIKYCIDVDLGYYMEYGNVRDFFIVVTEIAINILAGLTLGFGLVLIINLFCKKKCFDFLTNNKKLIYIGLISSVLVVVIPIIRSFFVDVIDIIENDYYFENAEMVSNLFTYIIEYCFYNIFYTGLIIYFSMIISRMNGKKCNIKLANILLIISLVIYTFMDTSYDVIVGLICMITNVLCILYLIKILFKKRIFINNKIFALCMIGRELIDVLVLFESIKYVNFIYEILLIVCILSRMLIIPYFYNYQELLKEENKNV